MIEFQKFAITFVKRNFYPKIYETVSLFENNSSGPINFSILQYFFQQSYSILLMGAGDFNYLPDFFPQVLYPPAPKATMPPSHRPLAADPTSDWI